MSEQFEKFVRDNLEEFDKVESPDVDQYWNEFREGRSPGRVRKLLWPLSIAASLLLLVGLCFFSTNKIDNAAPQAQWVIQNLEQNDPHTSEYQAMLVSTLFQQDSIIKTLNVIPEEHQDIYSSLADLELLEKEYMQDLQKNGSDQKIILALFKCAKQRIRLYELILYELDLKNYHEQLDHKIEI